MNKKDKGSGNYIEAITAMLENISRSSAAKFQECKCNKRSIKTRLLTIFHQLKECVDTVNYIDIKSELLDFLRRNAVCPCRDDNARS